MQLQMANPNKPVGNRSGWRTLSTSIFNNEKISIAKKHFYSLKTEFFRRVPENLLKVNYFIIFDFDSFFFQKSFHAIRCREMVFATKHTVTVYYSMSGNFWSRFATAIHCPANHASRKFCSKDCSNCAI